MEDAESGVAQVPKALTRPPQFLELLNRRRRMCPWTSSWRRTRRSPRCPTPTGRGAELMAKAKEQASSEEPGGSVFTKALKVSEGLYQFSEDQMAGDFPCFDATTATRLRRLQAKDVQRLLRGFEGPQLKQKGPGARCGSFLHRQDEV